MKIVHLSDLHFGTRMSQEKLRSLKSDVIFEAPELLVVTGDITDRGHVSQFRLAKDFLASLQIPFMSVPGNREISAFAVWEWMFPRLAMGRYRRFFGQEDRIMYRSEENRTVFFGLNSVHAFPSWPGTIRRESRHWLKAQAARFADYAKVVFLHHPALPVIRSSSFWAHTLSDAGELLNICTQTGINLILQGHKHRSSVMEVRFPQRNAQVVVSSCGAPLMSRWDAAYHIIHVDRESIVVRPREFQDGKFTETGVYTIPLQGNHNGRVVN
jgi:3',5'-cyclic AMP phosphodiesterase CpdA